MNRSATDPTRNRVRWPREARETHEEAQRRLVAQTRAIEQPVADLAWLRYFARLKHGPSPVVDDAFETAKRLVREHIEQAPALTPAAFMARMNETIAKYEVKGT